MLITCIAHSMFLIELASGLRIVTDPVGADSGYPVAPVRADVVLVSHHHHDHCCMDSVSGSYRTIDAAGEYTLEEGVSVTAIPSWHDDQQGKLRGENLMFLLQSEGLSLAHLGDLGHLPTAEQVKALTGVDLLLLPVGGHFTIDAQQAASVAASLRARVILPMHYRTVQTASWPIRPLDDFTALYAGQPIRIQPVLRVTDSDLMCMPKVCVLEPQLRG